MVTMGINRRLIRRLENAVRGDLDSFALLDGSRYYFDLRETSKVLFLHALGLQMGRPAEPPEVFQKLTQARDPGAVLERLEPESTEAFVNSSELYDRDILVSERRLVPNVGEKPEDLSEGA